MQMKRNIRKKSSVNSNSKFPTKLVCNRNCIYNFPKEDEVPSDLYFSTIRDAKFDVGKNGGNVLDVFYELKPLTECYRFVNNMDDKEPNVYCIKQRYPLDSMPYNNFLIAMCHALDIELDEEFGLEELIGVTEKISLTYFKDDGIGGIDRRQPFNWEDLKENDD